MATTPQPLTSSINGNPRTPPAGSSSPSRVSRTSTRPTKAPRNGARATWFGICVAALVLVALIVFMLQNTQLVQVFFLGMQGTVPLALALFIAGVGVGLVAVIGSVRVGHLRAAARSRS